jgi:hypothetical protein
MVRTKMTLFQRVFLFCGVAIALIFSAYVCELLWRTNFGSSHEFLGADTIFYAFVAGILGMTIPVFITRQMHVRRYVVSLIIFFEFPLLLWFAWALTTGMISDKTNCVSAYGFLKCVFIGVP